MWELFHSCYIIALYVCIELTSVCRCNALLVEAAWTVFTSLRLLRKPTFLPCSFTVNLLALHSPVLHSSTPLPQCRSQGDLPNPQILFFQPWGTPQPGEGLDEPCSHPPSPLPSPNLHYNTPFSSADLQFLCCSGFH